MRKLSSTYNLAKVNPKVAHEWHPIKNGDLRPEEFVPYSNKKVWWKCPKNHEWTAIIANRNKGTGCPICAGKNKTIAYYKKIAQDRNGKCISEKYENSKKKLRWRCHLQHEWEAVPYTIEKGSWCPKCAVLRNAHRQRQTIEDMQRLAALKGGKVLSTEYKGANIKLLWQCRLGHEWEASPSRIKQGRWCHICSTGVSERICRKYFEEIFAEKFPKTRPNWLKSKGGTQLELDGYCKKLRVAFEYQGVQHYKHIKFFHHNQCFKERKEVDELKIRLCEQHGVKLILVPYTVEHDQIGGYIKKQCQLRGILLKGKAKKINYVDFDIYSPDMLKEMNKTASSRGGVCLSKVYVDISKKMLWRCEKGHQWTASARKIRSGTWCPVCAKNIKSTLHEMKKLAKARGGKCLSNKYTNTMTSLLWECRHGHKWKALPDSIKRGTWCPFCAGRNKTIKDMQQVAFDRGGECLSQSYYDDSTKLKWKCKVGHVWEAVPSSILGGTWCPICSHNVATIEEMISIARQHGGQCLSPKYEGSRKKLKWRCGKGHVWEATSTMIRSGQWCIECKKEKKRSQKLIDLKEVASRRGGSCLSKKYVNSDTKILWQCAKGHVWEARPDHVKRGSWCPICWKGQKKGGYLKE